MADITVTSVGPREFQVQVREDDLETSHRVTVPESLIDELQLPEDDLERVVRESFVFLLEREPASSIMSEFSLDVISGYFPEYKKELPERIQRWPCSRRAQVPAKVCSTSRSTTAVRFPLRFSASRWRRVPVPRSSVWPTSCESSSHSP